MKWSVIVFPGSNCDVDAANAIRQITGDEVQLIWHTEATIGDADAIVLPGGFSYGDYLRSGAIARFSPVMQKVAEAAREGKLVLGICNGFQVLTESGLLPGALVRNEALQFRCEPTSLTIEVTDSPFTHLYERGTQVRFPIAHGEGRYVLADACEPLVALRYVANPNGSDRDIAGVLNEERNVLGMMPHPERAVASWMQSEDGVRLFHSMKQWHEGRVELVRGEKQGLSAPSEVVSVSTTLATSTASLDSSVASTAPEAKGQQETGGVSGPTEMRPALPRPGVEPSPQMIQSERIYRQLGLTDEEYQRLVTGLGRLPNYVETGVFGVLWSEHCSYKSSRVYLKQFPTEGPQVLQGPGENAGVIDVGEGLAVAFKMESHNHPSAIEPVQGAATGVGGILRDVFTMGARPIAFLDSLRFGPIEDGQTRHLLRGVVEGIGMYGNCVGIPTVGGEVSFDRSYQRNPLVNAMCVGVLAKDGMVKGAAVGVGNPVFIVGARTGRDGIHGATFASAEDPHAKERSAVQVGDPFLGKLLMEACLELIATGHVVGIQDMGAAGITSSSAEMASRAGGGMDLYLDRVPVREAGITPYEMMLSESQERMLVVLKKGEEEAAFSILRKWGLEIAEIGRVTEEGRLRCWFGEEQVADVPVDLLVDDAPLYSRPTEAMPPSKPVDVRLVADVIDRMGTSAANALWPELSSLLGHPSVAWKGWVFRQYDTMVRTSTVLGPGSDAAVVQLPDADTCIAISTDGNGRYTALNPRRGGAIAVAEAARNVVCSGGQPLAFTNCLNFGNPEKPHIMWQFAEATAGMSELSRALNTPVVSGNVSLYNQTGGQDIHPTPVVGMVGRLDGIGEVVPSAFQTSGSTVVVMGPEDTALDGTLYVEQCAGEAIGDAPTLDVEMEVKVQQTALAWMKQGWVRAAHDVSEGGIGVALAEMCVGGATPIGFTSVAGGDVTTTMTSESGIEVAPADALSDLGWLVSEGQSRILLEVPADVVPSLLADARYRGVPARVVGVTGGGRLAVSSPLGRPLVDVALSEVEAVYRHALESHMQDGVAELELVGADSMGGLSK